MSSPAGFVGPGKKAVHVKWAGKTIALGTFASADADEKCARAKALTRAWRSTMRPKPTREWVMAELERLGVRVVSGRLGRKAGEDDEPGEKKSSGSPTPMAAPVAPNMGPSWSSSTSELDNIIQRRNSSLGLSMMSDRDFNRRGSLGSLGPMLGFDNNDPTVPPHRPLVGGGSAAAYEAARADHYAQKREEQVRGASLGLPMGGGGSNVSMGGLSVNPNQHYEMLKLHHMNLLNEIQETTLMMNLYQQQQLQQQQQQLQQRQASVEVMLPDIDVSRRRSLSLGSDGGESAPAPAPKKAKSRSSAAPSVAKKSTKAMETEESINAMATLAELPQRKSDLEEELLRSQKEHEALEAKLKKIKEDIARREKEAEELQKKADAAGLGSISTGDHDKNDESEKETAKEDESESSSI